MTGAWDFAAHLDDLAEADLRRHLTVVDSPPGPTVVIDGAEHVLMCSNNYLGLAGDPRLAHAAALAAKEWGAGSGGSRLVSGSTSLHAEAEARLAAFEGAADCLLFSSGYLANVGTISALVGPGDAVVSDALNHASIIDGCRLSGARVEVYRHGDAAHAARLVAEVAATGSGRVLVVTDSVFSMDGDVAPLADLVAVAESTGAFLVVDEAHATGVLGPAGRGAVAAAGLEGRVDAIVGTCSKALGSAGGYVAGSADLCDWLRNRARTFVFDTAPAPASVAATLAALDVLEAEPERAGRVLAHARRLAAGLRDLGYDVWEPAAAVVPVVVGKAADALALGARIRDRGGFAPPIRPPSVPPGTARIRLCPMATHTDAHVDAVLAAFT